MVDECIISFTSCVFREELLEKGPQEKRLVPGRSMSRMRKKKLSPGEDKTLEKNIYLCMVVVFGGSDGE